MSEDKAEPKENNNNQKEENNKDADIQTGYQSIQGEPVPGKFQPYPTTAYGTSSQIISTGPYVEGGEFYGAGSEMIEGGMYSSEGMMEGGEEMISGGAEFAGSYGAQMSEFRRSYDKQVIDLGYVAGPPKIYRKTVRVPYTDYKLIKVPTTAYRTVQVPYTNYIEKRVPVQKFKEYERVDRVQQRLVIKRIPYEKTVTEYRNQPYRRTVTEQRRVPFQKKVVDYRMVPVQKVVTTMVRKPFTRFVTDYKIVPYERIVTEMRKVPFQRKVYEYRRVTVASGEKPLVKRTVRRLDGGIEGGEIQGEGAYSEMVEGGMGAMEGMTGMEGEMINQNIIPESSEIFPTGEIGGQIATDTNYVGGETVDQMYSEQ